MMMMSPLSKATTRSNTICLAAVFFWAISKRKQVAAFAPLSTVTHLPHTTTTTLQPPTLSHFKPLYDYDLTNTKPSSSALFAKGKTKAVASTAVWKLPIVQQILTFLTKVSKVIFEELQALTPIQKLLFVGVFVLGTRMGGSGILNLKRYKEAVDIPSGQFGPKAKFIKGRVVSVSDGDTFRFYHVPTPLHPSTLKKGQKVSEVAMPIRICTFDTPETPKFGKPGQPFGIEAKEELKSLIDGKLVKVRLLQKDQYGRAVAQVRIPGRFGKCVDEHMLQAGLAEVYQGGGAVYGPLGKEKYLELEAEAKKKKVGIWSQKKRESAAEYKKRTK